MKLSPDLSSWEDNTLHPSNKEAEGGLAGNSAPCRAPSSAAARGAVSGWAQPRSFPGLQLEQLKWAPTHKVLWDQRDQRQHVRLSPAPPAASDHIPLRPHSAWLWSLSDPFQGDAIVTSTIPAPPLLGLINGLSARAGAQDGVYETFTSPLRFWDLALLTGSQPLHSASEAARGSPEQFLSQTLVWRWSSEKHLFWRRLSATHRPRTSRGAFICSWSTGQDLCRQDAQVPLGPSSWRYLSQSWTCLELFTGPHGPQDKSKFLITAHGALHGGPRAWLSLCVSYRHFTEFSRLPTAPGVCSSCPLCLGSSPHPSSGSLQGILKSHWDITSARKPHGQGQVFVLRTCQPPVPCPMGSGTWGWPGVKHHMLLPHAWAAGWCLRKWCCHLVVCFISHLRVFFGWNFYSNILPVLNVCLIIEVYVYIISI